MPGKKNSLANGLSRRPPNSERPNKLSTLEYIAALLKIEAGLLLEDLYLEES
jgi:hypothetical protein